MGMKKSKTHYRSSVPMPLIFLCLLSPSAAYCQSTPASTSTQKWADPGAIEKAKTQTSTQDQNRNLPLSATLPTSTSFATERVSPSAIQKPARVTRSSSISGGETVSKIMRPPMDPTIVHPIKHHEVKAIHSTFPETLHASRASHNFVVSRGHVIATGKAQPHSAKNPAVKSAGTKAGGIVHDSLPGNKDAPPSSTVVEFDPVYGYSNAISVAY